MLFESKCTLYRDNGSGGFYRYIISECHWQEDRAANVLKSGLQTADSVSVYIPKRATASNFVPDGEVFPAVVLFPTADISPKNPSKDMLVKGTVSFEFDNSSPAAVSASMKLFRAQFPQFVTVSSIDRKLYGPERLQHIKISAK